MKLHSIILSRVIRYIQGSNEKGGVYMPDVVCMMQKKFRFLQVPTKLEEYDTSKGIRFLYGTFDGIIIDLLEIYNNGIMIQTRANSKYADRFADALIESSAKELKLTLSDVHGVKRNYSSELEVIIDKDISSYFDRLKSVRKIINDNVSQYAENIPPFEGAGLILQCDLERSPHLKPMRFVIERRMGQLFDSDMYYTSAPLPTDAHLKALKELEHVL